MSLGRFFCILSLALPMIFFGRDVAAQATDLTPSFQPFFGTYSLWDVFDVNGRGLGIAAIYYGNIVTVYDYDCSKSKAMVNGTGASLGGLPAEIVALNWPGIVFRHQQLLATGKFDLDALGKSVTTISWITSRPGKTWKRDVNPPARATCPEAKPPKSGS
jgi:hypothetical protein